MLHIVFGIPGNAIYCFGNTWKCYIFFGNTWNVIAFLQSMHIILSRLVNF